MKRIVLVPLAILLLHMVAPAQHYPLKNVLIISETMPDLQNEASGVPRDLAQLLGHFNTRIHFASLASYRAGEISRYQALFYIGRTPENHPPTRLIRDIQNTHIPVVWLNTGIADFLATEESRKAYGFSVTRYLENSSFDSVRTPSFTYTKGSGEINLVRVHSTDDVRTIAYAVSSGTKEQVPYMIRSGSLWYVADIPFLGAKVTDRYLLFADKLHDILGELHAESHKALVRIEDVTPAYDPEKLRQVADVLSDRGIPFLVGVVPVYVNPERNERFTLSDRPKLVAALKYMVAHGGSVVMHGTTHQFRGISANDGEFWDAGRSRPLPEENPADYAKKIEAGLKELVRNGLYPVAWETPHYMGSTAFFNVVSTYFSTAVEQRMSINNFDYGQYFPYRIGHDLYGQKIIPENLGYVPLKPDIRESRAAIDHLIRNAVAIRQVRDGIAGCFFHSFLDISLLKELVDGITTQGYTFMDLKDERNSVKTKDFVILTGSQTFTIDPDNSFLREQYIGAGNKVYSTSFSRNRIKGELTKTIRLKPGEMYVAEAVDYKKKQLTLKGEILGKVDSIYHRLFTNNDWQPARIKVVWNPAATGPAFLDQSAFISVFRNLNLPVDTQMVTQPLELAGYNLLVVPYASADRLSRESRMLIRAYLENGGNVVSDRSNNLVRELGITFANTKSKLRYIRDTAYPDELITWPAEAEANILDYDAADQIFCEETTTGLPVAIGREFNHGRLIYLNTALDPLTPKGYSYYPYFADYVRRFFRLQPMVKNPNLEFYFDPGYRTNANIEELVQQWVKQGIRRIHVAGWHHYRSYTYDYAHLILHAHANGILVYAWFEPPQVSKKFWDDHPEWREKNHLGQDIHQDENTTASWRYPVALTDKNCFREAMKEYIGLLEKHDFDGVNIAELNFEAGRGFDDPALFTPMHLSAVDQFRRSYGYNLKEIFDPGSSHYWKTHPEVQEQVTAFRVDRISGLHESFLEEIMKFAKTRSDFDIVVTFYDTYFSPELTVYHGVSADRILDLRKKYAFHLQPEDPLGKWSTDPDRYVEMGKLYRSKMTDPSDLMLDLNIYHFREKEQVSPFPTLIQTGTEAFQVIHAAASSASRFTVYSESSCNTQDMSWFAYAAAGMVRYRPLKDGLSVSSPVSFVLQLPPSVRAIEIDGIPVYGSRGNQFLVPAGGHTITTGNFGLKDFSDMGLKPRLISFSGNLLSVDYQWQKISIIYQSKERTMASVDKYPVGIKVDGAPYEAEILKGNDCFTVRLPAGNHQVELITDGIMGHRINQASIWAMNIIAVYGLVAALLMANLFIALKFIRKKYQF